MSKQEDLNRQFLQPLRQMEQIASANDYSFLAYLLKMAVREVEDLMSQPNSHDSKPGSC